MSYCKAIAAILMAAPMFAQYGGPAVLTRGQAPAAMAASQIDFRPFLNVSGSYESGLNGVGVDPNGNGFNESSMGIQASGGVSGLHSWKRTQVGLNYQASISHYLRRSFYDNTTQSLLLGITHQVSRHIMLSINTNAGISSRGDTQMVLLQTVAFDPATTYVPSNEFFDNRTMYFSTQATVQVQKSTRLSYSLGVDGFITRRRSTALFGVTGTGAHGDVQYRASRRSTIGAGYNYTHYSFNHIFSSTDLHAMVASYAIRLTKALEFSSTAGATQYETKFIQTVPIDPAIAALIGISSARQVSYNKRWIPSLSARLSYTMKRGVVFFNGGRSITPGNGLFLTSTATTVGAGYSYTALRRWGINVGATYNDSQSQGNYIGSYGGYNATGSVSRQVARFTHGVLSFNARKFESPDFKAYNKWTYGVHLGLSFTPGDIPLRLW